MSRAQRYVHSIRCGSAPIRPAQLLSGSCYAPIQFVPAVKLVTGNADPTR